MEIKNYFNQQCSVRGENMDLSELKKACTPAFEFLRRYGNPHESILINYNSAKIVSDEAGIPLEIEHEEEKTVCREERKEVKPWTCHDCSAYPCWRSEENNSVKPCENFVLW